MLWAVNRAIISVRFTFWSPGARSPCIPRYAGSNLHANACERLPQWSSTFNKSNTNESRQIAGLTVQRGEATLMRYGLVMAVTLVAAASFVVADHRCVEEFPEAASIKMDRPFPAEWFVVGSMSLTDEAIESKLVRAYGRTYRKYDDEEFGGGGFCTVGRAGYFGISINDLSRTVEYAASRSKCSGKCRTTSARNDLPSGTGLRVGQARSDVGRLLGVQIVSDITELKFEEAEISANVKIWHFQWLWMQFRGGRLARFMVSDSREREQL